jgi:hypothetical protein
LLKSPSSILHVKNLRQIKKMLDKLFVAGMLQRVFHTFAGHLQFLMCAKLGMAFLTRIWYSFNTLGSILKGETSSYMSTMSQRSIDANNILFLNFQRLNFPPLNLSMIVAALLLNDIVLRSDIRSKHSIQYMPKCLTLSNISS